MRTKNSIINVIVALVTTAITSILSLISTNLILQNYGSDFNGVIATVSQLISILLLLEGGITYAANFALYKPYIEKDYKKINLILNKTFKQFIKLGSILFVMGVFISFIYPIFMKSGLKYFDIVLIILMVVTSTSFNLFFTVRLNVLFQASQKEYILNIITFVINVITTLITIFMVYNRVNMLYVRLNVMASTFFIGICTYYIFKRKFNYVKFDLKNSDIKIDGSRDIIIQRITGTLYGTIPIMFMSSFIGTICTSIYAVYNSIFTIIKTVMYSVVAAPSNGFGQLMSYDNKKKAYEKYLVYEFIVIVILSLLLSSVLSVIIPFIRLYTKNINDVQYVNYIIALLFGINTFLEIMHTPSGTIISVSGKFKVARNIQIIACIVLIPTLIIGAICYNIYGMMLALILTSLSLAIMEIIYAHTKVFNGSVKNFLKVGILNLVTIIICAIFWNILNISFNSYLTFVSIGILVLVLNSIIIIFFNFIFFKKHFKSIKSMLLSFKKS